MKVSKLIISLFCMAALVCSALGQARPGSAPAKPAAAGAKPAAAVDNSPNTYRSMGKRDPFRSLQASKQVISSTEALVAPPAKLRPPGLPGMLVSEVNIIGIAGSKDERLAVIQGRDKVNYLGKVGDKLYNGLIAEIDTDDKGYFVSFLEELRYPDGKVVRKKTVRRLYAEQSSS